MPSHPTIVASSLPECPICGKAVDNYGLHWARWCEFPSLVDEQHEVIAGLLLGGAVLHTRTANPSLIATTRHHDLAVWTADQLGWLTSSVKRVSVQSDDGDSYTYKVTTRTHPELERYTQWFGDGEKSPPVSSLRLSRRVVRTWYAYSAYVAWTHDHDSRETGFSAKSETKRQWVGALLERLGYDPSYRHHSWYLPPADTRDLLEWCGGPVPGVEYKWAMRNSEYDDLRRDDDQPTDRIALELYPPGTYDPVESELPSWEPERELYQQYSDDDCLGALYAVADYLDVPIFDVTIREYDRTRWMLGDAPGSTLIADRFGGWDAAKWALLGQLRREGARPRLSRREAKAALREVGERIDEPLTELTYDEYRDVRHPSAGGIIKKFGWADMKREAGFEPIAPEARIDTEAIEKADAIEALREVATRVDGTLSRRAYDTARDDDHPASQTLVRNFGWNDLKRAAGLEVNEPANTNRD